MAAFGTFTLLIALIVATYGGVASVVGARRRSLRLIESGRAAAYALAAILSLTSVAIVYAFVTHDYSIKYVQRYSDASSPLFYKITAYWGGLDGSILWWVFLLSVFSAIAIYSNRHRHKEIMPYVVATLMGIADFFLFIIVFHKNPFDTFLTQVPTTGEGLNPILQNAYMVTHPPSLYTGLVGMSIPYAFAMGALISGHLDDAWIAAVRKWTLLAWFFLAQGLTLGMLWAYEELGWGGFWAWDPVENAGFIPWLTGTAFLHSVMIQERRGMLKIWNFTLVILTFLLTIVATFLTRSGVVESVHAFGKDPKLAMMFGIFMATIVVVSFGFMIARLPELRSRARLDSWLSREAAFLVNNWILLFAAFFVLFATLFPTLSEAVTGQRIRVGEPVFNRWMVPIGIVLLFLTGVGPLIAWRKATPSHLRYQFTWPVTAAVTTLVTLIALGYSLQHWAAISCFSLCAFVTGTIVQEFARGASVRKRNTGSDVVTALLGMVLRGRRRYGGYVVHMGIVFMFLGWAGQSYKSEAETNMVPGAEFSIGKYVIKYSRLTHEEDRQKEMVTGELMLFKEGKELGRLRPAKWFFQKKPGEPTTEVAIHRSPVEDFYVTLGNYDFTEGTAALKVVINPLVDWIWFGFMMLAIGTGITLLPEAVLVPLAARAGVAPVGPTGAAGHARSADSGLATLLVFVGAAAVLLGGARTAYAAESPGRGHEADRQFLMSNIVCMCGCLRPLNDCGMINCGKHEAETAKVDELLGQGKSRDEIVASFIAEYGGQHILTAPLDKGFNRLVWALPYGFGIAGVGALAVGAWRFAKRAPVSEVAPTVAKAETELEDRLDDELDRIDS